MIALRARRTRAINRTLILIAIGAMITAAALVLTVPRAAADITDTTFIAALDQRGIDYPSAGYAIRAAHSICDTLDAGVAPAAAAMKLAEVSYLNLSEAGYFVGASIGVYCSWHAADLAAAAHPGQVEA